MFCTDRYPTVLDRVNRHTLPLHVPADCETTCFLTKTRTIILFTNTTLNHLGFGGTAIEHFHFRNNVTEEVLVYKSSNVGIELLS